MGSARWSVMIVLWACAALAARAVGQDAPPAPPPPTTTTTTTIGYDPAADFVAFEPDYKQLKRKHRAELKALNERFNALEHVPVRRLVLDCTTANPDKSGSSRPVCPCRPPGAAALHSAHLSAPRGSYRSPDRNHRKPLEYRRTRAA